MAQPRYFHLIVKTSTGHRYDISAEINNEEADTAKLAAAIRGAAFPNVHDGKPVTTSNNDFMLLKVGSLSEKTPAATRGNGEPLEVRIWGIEGVTT